VVLKAYPDPTNRTNARRTLSRKTSVAAEWREEIFADGNNLTKKLTAMMRFTNDYWTLGPPDGDLAGEQCFGPSDNFGFVRARGGQAKWKQRHWSTAVKTTSLFLLRKPRQTLLMAEYRGLCQQLKQDDQRRVFPLLQADKYGDKGPAEWIPLLWSYQRLDHRPVENQMDCTLGRMTFHSSKGTITPQDGGLLQTDCKAEQGE